MVDASMNSRAFKTSWFRKARITDDELCKAVREIMRGQADDLGGGVFKKRLNKNRHRSILLAKGGDYWVYQYLYAKQDRANIESDELDDFRELAKAYKALTDEQLARLLRDNELTEICHDGQT